MNKVDRYKILVRYLVSQGIAASQKDLGVKLGYKNESAFSQVINGKVVEPKNFMTKLKNVIPELNTSWLLSGDGEMLNGAEDECGNDDLDPVILKKTGGRGSDMIPFYDAETTGGYNDRVSSSDVEARLAGYIQPGGWFDGRETAAIRHVGDSMTEYPNGCVLAVREVTERRLLVPGRNYVIETSEFRVTKRVQRGSSPDKIALYSSNEEKYEDGRLVHEPFEVEFDDVRRIFSVLGYIVNQFGECRLIKP